MELKEELLEITASKTIQTKSDGKHVNPKLKVASMFLQNLGIAKHNVSEAIKLVV